MSASGLHISISAETITQVGGLPISNSMLTSCVVSGLIVLTALIVHSRIKHTSKPTGVQNIAEMLFENFDQFVFGIVESRQKTQLFFPLITSFFLFIMLNNYFGLLPGVGTIGMRVTEEGTEHAVFLENSLLVSSPVTPVQAATPVAETEHTEKAPVESTENIIEATSETQAEQLAEGKFIPYFRPGTADLNTNLALAIISVVATQYYGLRFLNLSYLKKFFNFSNPMDFVVGLLELNSEFSKIISFAFRLFGNIFAGEVLISVMAFLGGSLFFFLPMPFYGLEFFVGFIQALVFSMLTLVFFKVATQGHEH